MNQVLEILRRATESSPYRGRLYLVGGAVRDKLLGRSPRSEVRSPMPPASRHDRRKEAEEHAGEDIDIVLEGDAAELAVFLYCRGIAEHKPVVYTCFGTAMITVRGRQVELVGARRESYRRESRKPLIEPGTLFDDVARRDFTINTLLENLHTGEVHDLTGLAIQDIRDRLIRTPLDPRVTFEDDPLRMLRAVRFATRFGFTIHADTLAALSEMAPRLQIISRERIRQEFIKIVMSPNATSGLETLRETGLLSQFAPELVQMYGVTQNVYHIHDVWTHTMKTLESIPPDSGIILRLSALLHDVGKVETRSVDEDGNVHFYSHQIVGAQIARRLMRRLRFSNSQTDRVAFFISMHLRVGEYDNQWTDAAVRRLIRDAGAHLDDAIRLTQADKSAANTAMPSVDLAALQAHIARVREGLHGKRLASPLTGREIMHLLGAAPGPRIGEVKAFLEREVIEGNLTPEDKAEARRLVLREYGGAGG